MQKNLNTAKLTIFATFYGTFCLISWIFLTFAHANGLRLLLKHPNYRYISVFETLKPLYIQ